ncbi:type II secretion system major pseudopilin GspG [Pseudoalteromonas piscicida]|uniref:Type II secretion system core protein G n=2 Tax=Pseudoalteromonas piscicida TaxID=43662 RepID=A0AAD0W2K1_PSEO7|nr:type II secretion system major pseudopilin GspG [Pseudoalteromonas piscicida]ASD68149.1 type II secretion system protein GspG [Pseudoalteromonas piscicida]AXR01145.1 type II secretion system protein GspG [Pseudoalteromonas piscicida]
MTNNMKTKNKHNGFTMMELLIVIVILGLLMSLVAPDFFKRLSSSERKIAAAQMSSFETAIDTYRLDVGSYPKSLQELRSSDVARWDGPYLPKDVPMDPWGNAYVYKVPGDNGAPYLLKSLGADGQEGGEETNADIVHQ